MKKIIVVESDKVFDSTNNNRILIKKNKTIIKDLNYFNTDFFNELDQRGFTYKKMVEEWEVLNNDKIQVICTPSGNRVKPIHVVSDVNPKQGAKVLFQSERLTTLTLCNGTISIRTYFVDDNNSINSNVIYEKEYQTYDDIYLYILSNFKPIIDSIILTQDNHERDGYLNPIWSL